MTRTRIAILGAGPAGVGAAWQLVKQGKADVTVLEQREDVGGNAGSFELAGLSVDYGSHRLHPACHPKILDDLRELMGEDLLDRPRHGRIRLQERWIHFPLKPQDLMLRLPFSFSTGVARDALGKFIPHKSNGNGHETFTSVLEKGLGATICRDFYFPYAEKIWGLPPEELSATQAHRRVSAGSLGKMVKKVLSIVPGFKTPGAGRFFYPRNGYGQISQAIANKAQELGADIKLNSNVLKIELGEKHRVTYQTNSEQETIEADYVWSTIPLTVLARIVNPSAPTEVLEASKRISYRAMVLIYLVLDQSQWTEFDAHYFPEADIKLTRLSEPKNYSATDEPKNKTILCGELPCTVNDDVWNASDDELAQLVKDAVERCGLPIQSKVMQVVTKRLPFAYPIYREGYEKHFELQDKWASGLERVLTFGRQGLFAHDNTHHALAMAYGAVDCLKESDEFDTALWQENRAEFTKHVVED
jgi:protoporphyrinogen oxidase